MDGDPFDLVGDVIDGQFRVDEVAGEGDLSVVYRGWHQGVSAIVAIKCLNLPATLDPKLVEPFVESFHEGTKLHYKLARGNLNIAQSLASGTTLAPRTGQLVPYHVREWFEGHSLAVEMEKRRAVKKGPWTLAEIMTLLEGAADGLAYAHAQGIAHHSINPTNLFIVSPSSSPSIKILDFGVAKLLNEPRAGIAGLRVLMPQYAAPEQIDRQLGGLGPWTDVYALALIVMEALVGKPLIASKEGAPAAQLDRDHRPGTRAFGVMLPKAVEDVLARAVEIDPLKRPPDAAVFWRALKDATVLQPKAPPPKATLSGAMPKVQAQAPSSAAAPAQAAAPVNPLANAPIGGSVGPPAPPRVAPQPSPPVPLVKSPPAGPPIAAVPPAGPPPVPAVPAGPRSLSLTRKTIAGLGGEKLPVLPPTAPSASAPSPVATQAAVPPPVAAKLVIPPPPMMQLQNPVIPQETVQSQPHATPRGPASPSLGATPSLDHALPKVIVSEPPPKVIEPHAAPAGAIDTEPPFRPPPPPSLAPAAALRKVRTLVMVGIGVSVAALVALVGLAIYVLVILPAHVATALPPPPSSVEAPSQPPEPPQTAAAASASAPEPADTAKVPPGIAKRFTRAAGMAALDAINEGLSSCARPGGASGTGSIRVTFGNDGSVIHLTLGPPFTGTPEGACVAEHFRGARVQAFRGNPGAINYTFTVAP